MCEIRTPTERDLPWDRPVTRRDLLRYGSMLGFSALGASVFAACSPVSDLTGTATPKADAVPPAEAKYVVLLVLDACRGDYIGKTYGPLPNILSLYQRGTWYPNAWCGQMEAITPASHASIGSGMFPKHNGGILGFWWENPTDHTNYTCADLTNTRIPGDYKYPLGLHHAVDPNVIETILRDAKTPSMAGLMKDFDPTAKIYAASGNKFYAANAMGGPDADYMSYFWNDGESVYRPLSIPGHPLPDGILTDPRFKTTNYGTMTQDEPGKQDTLVVEVALQVIEKERPRIVMLNLPELDWPVAHEYGGPLDASSNAQVKIRMQNADRNLGRIFDLYKHLGIYDQTIFALVGDHGVTPLAFEVDAGNSQYPGPAYDAVQGSASGVVTTDIHTGAFYWAEDLTQSTKSAEVIDQARIPGVRAVYFLGETGGRVQYMPSPATAASITPAMDNAYRYLLETMNGTNAPHVALLYPEYVGTLHAGGSQHWRGDHGGASWGSQSLAMLVAGPGIRPQNISQFPARLVDLAPTFLRLLGAPYPQLDGVALADAFTKPTKTEVSDHRRLARTIVPVTNTLRSQSAVDWQTLPANQRKSIDKGKIKIGAGGANYNGN